MGYHAEELPPHNLESVLHYFWASVWVHMIALGVSKLSILTQYLRIFLDRRTRLLTWLTMAFVIVYTLQAILVGVFVCIPVEAFWNRSMQGHCINPLITNYVNAGFNISTDLIIILIPIPALNKLQVSKSQYIALLVAFSIGGLYVEHSPCTEPANLPPGVASSPSCASTQSPRASNATTRSHTTRAPPCGPQSKSRSPSSAHVSPHCGPSSCAACTPSASQATHAPANPSPNPNPTPPTTTTAPTTTPSPTVAAAAGVAVIPRPGSWITRRPRS